tara:strand:- start:608 stop:889 length:282 start_codon:yes stop_codon:yes gene_type:complete
MCLGVVASLADDSQSFGLTEEAKDESGKILVTKELSNWLDVIDLDCLPRVPGKALGALVFPAQPSIAALTLAPHQLQCQPREGGPFSGGEPQV